MLNSKQAFVSNRGNVSAESKLNFSINFNPKNMNIKGMDINKYNLLNSSIHNEKQSIRNSLMNYKKSNPFQFDKSKILENVKVNSTKASRMLRQKQATKKSANIHIVNKESYAPYYQNNNGIKKHLEVSLNVSKLNTVNKSELIGKSVKNSVYEDKMHENEQNTDSRRFRSCKKSSRKVKLSLDPNKNKDYDVDCSLMMLNPNSPRIKKNFNNKNVSKGFNECTENYLNQQRWSIMENSILAEQEVYKKSINKNSINEKKIKTPTGTSKLHEIVKDSKIRYDRLKQEKLDVSIQKHDLEKDQSNKRISSLKHGKEVTKDNKRLLGRRFSVSNNPDKNTSRSLSKSTKRMKGEKARVNLVHPEFMGFPQLGIGAVVWNNSASITNQEIIREIHETEEQNGLNSTDGFKIIKRSRPKLKRQFKVPKISRRVTENIDFSLNQISGIERKSNHEYSRKSMITNYKEINYSKKDHLVLDDRSESSNWKNQLHQYDGINTSYEDNDKKSPMYTDIITENSVGNNYRQYYKNDKQKLPNFNLNHNSASITADFYSSYMKEAKKVYHQGNISQNLEPYKENKSIRKVDKIKRDFEKRSKIPSSFQVNAELKGYNQKSKEKKKVRNRSLSYLKGNDKLDEIEEVPDVIADYTLYTRFYKDPKNPRLNFKFGKGKLPKQLVSDYEFKLDENKKISSKKLLSNKKNDTRDVSDERSQAKDSGEAAIDYSDVANFYTDDMKEVWKNNLRNSSAKFSGSNNDDSFLICKSANISAKKTVYNSSVPKELEKYHRIVVEKNEVKGIKDNKRFPNYHKNFYLTKGQSPAKNVDPAQKKRYKVNDPKEVVYSTAEERSRRLTHGKASLPYRKNSFIIAYDLKEADKLRETAILRKKWIHHIKSTGKTEVPGWLETINPDNDKLKQYKELCQLNNRRIQDRVKEVDKENGKLGRRLLFT